MDQGRLEELKRLLQKRHQEPKRGLEQNSNGENFKVPNSEIQNSEVSNFEVSNFEFLNFEPPNFESLNSKARDYDKNPLIIKDHTYYDYMKYSIIPTMVGLLIALAFATIVNPINIKMFRLLPLVLVIFVTNFMDRDGAYFVFYNDKFYITIKIRFVKRSR